MSSALGRTAIKVRPKLAATSLKPRASSSGPVKQDRLRSGAQCLVSKRGAVAAIEG